MNLQVPKAPQAAPPFLLRPAASCVLRLVSVRVGLAKAAPKPFERKIRLRILDS